MPVRLGMQIANVKHSHCEAKFAACGKPNLGAYTAKPNLPGDESVSLFLRFTIIGNSIADKWQARGVSNPENPRILKILILITEY